MIIIIIHLVMLMLLMVMILRSKDLLLVMLSHSLKEPLYSTGPKHSPLSLPVLLKLSLLLLSPLQKLQGISDQLCLSLDSPKKDRLQYTENESAITIVNSCKPTERSRHINILGSLLLSKIGKQEGVTLKCSIFLVPSTLLMISPSH